jgi:hypothetical protein
LEKKTTKNLNNCINSKFDLTIKYSTLARITIKQRQPSPHLACKMLLIRTLTDLARSNSNIRILKKL